MLRMHNLDRPRPARLAVEKRMCGALFLAVLALAGCASREHVRQTEVAENFIALYVEEARADGDNVFVRYSGAVEQVLDVEYREMVHAVTVPITGEDVVAPLEFVEAGEWEAAAADAEPVPVFSVHVYRDLVDALDDAVAPPNPGEGVAVRTDLVEWIIWRDEDGEVQADLLDDVIADVDLVDRFTPAELRDKAKILVADLLPPDTPRAIIHTGEEGPGSRPFVYVDLDRDQMNLLLLEGVRGAQPLEPVGMTADTALHLYVRSFLLEILRSPVRMGIRTVFGAGYTVGDLLFAKRAFDVGEQEAPPVNEGPGMDLEEFEKVLDRVTRTKRVTGRVNRVLIGGDEYFPVLRQAIARAEESIHLRTYLFDNDDYAVSVADRLKERSNEGIDVRILTDGLGTIIAATVDSPNMPADFQKPPKISLHLINGSKVKWRSQSNPFIMGDHAKTTIIDGKLAFVGGMNIGREYRYEWHDLMIEVEGPIVDLLEQEFRNIWELGGFFGDWQFALYGLFGEKVKVRQDDGTGYPIRMLKTVPGNSQIYTGQLEAIRRAQKYIYIENLYFSNALFLQELVEARQRGVDVRVVIPLKGNWGVLSESAMLTANKMFDAGIRVYMYPRMTHVKAAVYDGWACAGSANFDKLSFRLNEEINLCYTDPEAVGELIERLFEADFAESTEMTERFDTGALTHMAEIIADQL